MAIIRGFVRSKARLLVEWAETKAKRLEQAEGENLVGSAKAHAKTLRQDSGIAAVERLARSNEKSLSTFEQWDSDDFLLGTPGGTVDLRTGETREARRADYISRRTSVAPAAPGAEPMEWLRFLAQVFPDDPDMIGFMQHLMGYALTGSTREHRLFLFYGTGRNGKGTLLGTVQWMMGDYAKGIPTSTLLESRLPQHAAPLARLLGARFVRGAELPVGQAWSEGLVKMLTGGVSIPVMRWMPPPRRHRNVPNW
jgi:putative DNA primase/helicase